MASICGQSGRLQDRGTESAWRGTWAQPRKEWAFWKRTASVPGGPEFRTYGPVQMIALQPDLWVDPKGERFCDEGIAFYDTSVGNVNARYREGYTYSLFDDAIKEYYVAYGIHRNVGWKNAPGTKPAGFDDELKAAIEKGTTEAFAADSVEELAAKMAVEPAVLKATVEEYNRFCEKGRDELFAKEPKYLRPLRGPSSYAAKARTIFLVTLGGILKINHRMEVVDKKDRAIPGLYAGGMDASGMWGKSSPCRIPQALHQPLRSTPAG